MAAPVRVGLIGAGRIGTSHAELLATRVPGAELAAVADPRRGAAAVLTDRLGGQAYDDPTAVITAPDLDAVVITASSVAHAELVIAAAQAGKAVFCEKPMAMTLAEVDAVAAAVDAAGVPAQVGFNRRFDRGFAAAYDAVRAGRIGTPQLLRSLTRDPAPSTGGLPNPGAVPPWTIFTQTLIHDFDALCWLAGSEPVEVYASADALVAPDFKAGGLLDTAVVIITFADGARAVAEASFAATYGYDVRGEVFGSAGMVTVGDGARSTLRLSDAAGRHQDTARGDVELLLDAYVGEFVHFVDCVRTGTTPSPTVADARRALSIALACVESYQRHAPVTIAAVAAA